MQIHRPDPSRFESGDVLWRRRWTDVVPAIRPARAPSARRDPADIPPAAAGDASLCYRWMLQQALMLEQRLGLVDRLAQWKRPDGAATPRHPAGVPAGARASTFYIGHPAIIERAGDRLHVIDATPGRGGVAITPYDRWLDDLPGCSLWHGRLDGFDRARRAQVAERAASVARRPYSLLNLHLGDARSFYCSKLLWWAVRDSLGFAIDDNAVPTRYRWLMPKETASLDCFARLFWPSAY